MSDEVVWYTLERQWAVDPSALHWLTLQKFEQLEDAKKAWAMLDEHPTGHVLRIVRHTEQVVA